MFSIIATMAITNIVLIPYYFTKTFEYLVVKCCIPMLNNIYKNKNQKRFIHVTIYNKFININDESSSDKDEIIEKKVINEDKNKIKDSDEDNDIVFI